MYYRFLTLKKQNRIKFVNIHLVGSLIIILLATCTKEVTSSLLETDSFIHVYPAKGNQTVKHIKQTTDGGFLIVGSEGLKVPNDYLGTFLLKVSAAGKLETKDTITNEAMSTLKCTNLSDGGVVINTGSSPGFFLKVDKSLKKEPVYPYCNFKSYLISPILEMKDGSFQLSLSNGSGTGAPSFNTVIKVSPTLATAQIIIPDSTLGVKVLSIDLYNNDDPANYFFTGTCFKNWQGSWGAIRKVFVAKQQYQGSALITSKTLIIDPLNVSDQVNFPLLYVNTSDNNLILAINKTGLHSENKVQLVKVDSALNIVWQKDLNINIKGTFCNEISECKDGNYLIAGAINMSGKLSIQPFACKIDGDGNILWSKIYSTAFRGTFNRALQLSDGSYVFAGNTTGFGEGAEESDVFIIKTDKDGNLK